MPNETVNELVTDEDFVDYLLSIILHENGSVRRNINFTASVENLSGNINRVRRVRLSWAGDDERSYIIKHVPEHGRLERYPTITFPDNRLWFEAKWFEFCATNVSREKIKTPELISFSDVHRTIIMEDLQPALTLSDYCRSGKPLKRLLEQIGEFLAEVHRASNGKSFVPDNPAAAHNRPFVFSKPLLEPEIMRDLWRQKELSFLREKEGTEWFSEQIELQRAFMEVHVKRVLPALIKLEKNFKLCEEPVLTHGDLHSESILVREGHNVGVIDAELCDYGPPGFDLGMSCAHVWVDLISSDATRDKSFEAPLSLLSGYVRKSMPKEKDRRARISELLRSTAEHCGAEIVRRLLGAAGFNVELKLSQRRYLLDVAAVLLTQPDDYSRKWASLLASGR